MKNIQKSSVYNENELRFEPPQYQKQREHH